MNSPLRVLDTRLMPARWNIAMSAALAELHCAGAIPDTLRFHRYPRSVLLGRRHSMRREVRAKVADIHGREAAASAPEAHLQ